MHTRVLDLAQWKQDGHKWAMLTAYDYSTARAFAAADIPVLLVGDSAANVVYGYDTTTRVTLDEMIFLARGVVRGAPRRWWWRICHSAPMRRRMSRLLRLRCR